jgi:hypothetical protein
MAARYHEAGSEARLAGSWRPTGPGVSLRRMQARGGLALVLLFALALAACKRTDRRATERALEQATGNDQVEIDEDGDRVTLRNKSDEGESVLELGGGAHIPADFPKSIPIYPGSKIVAAVGVTQNGKRTHLVTLAAGAAPGVVFDYYKAELAKSLGNVSEVGLAGMYILTADDGKGLNVGVTVTPNDDKTSSVQLTATPE